jgi:hypothetical protein
MERILGSYLGVHLTQLPPTACDEGTGLRIGQFGKNHLGDRNEFLPTLHCFDEFWGYLYYLDAMEDPWHRNYPKDLLNRSGRATSCTPLRPTPRPTVDPAGARAWP